MLRALRFSTSFNKSIILFVQENIQEPVKKAHRALTLPKIHKTRLHTVRRLTRNTMHISNEQKDRSFCSFEICKWLIYWNWLRNAKLAAATANLRSVTVNSLSTTQCMHLAGPSHGVYNYGGHLKSRASERASERQERAVTTSCIAAGVGHESVTSGAAPSGRLSLIVRAPTWWLLGVDERFTKCCQ